MIAIRETSSTDRSDDELLTAFAKERQEDAFAEIVRRHGGMVLAVCRSVLGNSPDAEDAAQAVFLTLAQKASSSHVRTHLVGWLHRVAWYVATRGAKARAIRRRHEQEAARMRQDSAPVEHEAVPFDLLHAGLADLPEKYRVPLLLHHLEGRTQEQTAVLLGCGSGAVAMRLNRGRRMLRKLLRKRGVGVTAGGLFGLLAAQTSAGASPTFVSLATKAAVAALAKQLASTTVISGSTLALSKGAMHMLYWAKVKLVTAVAMILLTGGAVGTCLAVALSASHQALPAATAPAGQKQTITGVAKALPAYVPDKMDPKVASATVTVSANGTDTVYYVYGWGGVICAKNDGKTVEVTGVVRKTTAGQMTITAASVNVKVIVVQ